MSALKGHPKGLYLIFAGPCIRPAVIFIQLSCIHERRVSCHLAFCITVQLHLNGLRRNVCIRQRFAVRCTQPVFLDSEPIVGIPDCQLCGIG